MEKATNGLYVSDDYTGTLQNGKVFDTSHGRKPLVVHMGAGQMIKGFEEALEEMRLNEEKTFTISPENAYGTRKPNLIRSFPREKIPQGIAPQVGQTVELTAASGKQFQAQIIRIDGENVVVDFNHPLAGEVLTFQVKVVGISDSPS